MATEKPSTPFEFPYRFTALIETARKTLGPEWREFFNQLAQWDLERDDALEGYLGSSRLAGITGVQRDATQTISHNTETTITFDSQYLTNGGSDATWNGSTRLTIQTDGIYLVTGQVTWSNAGGGGTLRRGRLFKNGTSAKVGSSSSGSAAANPYNSYSKALELASGDYLEMKVYHDRGTGTTLTTVYVALEVILLGETTG